MKELRFRIILILAAIALSIYLLYPTYVDYRNTQKLNKILDKDRKEIVEEHPQLTKQQVDLRVTVIEDSIKASDPSIQNARAKRIKLGLDLQGGMRVVLEVNTAELLGKIAKNPDNTFKSVLAAAEKESKTSEESVVDIVGRMFEQRGIRLSRYFGNIRQSDSQILSDLKKDAEDAVTRAMEIIRNRVDQYGVSEPSIQRQGSRRIIVELPGVAREEEAKQLLQGTALLEFKLVKDPEFTVSVMKNVDNVLAGKEISDTTKSDTSETKSKNSKNNKTAKTDTSSEDTTKQLSKEEFAKEHPFFSIVRINQNTADGYVNDNDMDKLKLILNRSDV